MTLPEALPARALALRIALAAAFLPVLAAAARAESPEEKLCVFLSAERLPAVPGLAIDTASVTPAAVRSVTGDLVGYFSDPLRALDELGRRFGIPAGNERDIAIRRSVARGESEAAKAAIVDVLNGFLTGGARAEITVKAAGRGATYGYVCGWRSLKDVVSAPLGLVR